MVLVVLIDAYCTSAEIDARASGAKVAVALSPLVALCTASSHQGLVYNKNPFFRGIYHDSWCICIITLKEIEFGRFNHKNCVHSRMTAYNIYIYNYTYIYILFTQCVYIYILFIYLFLYWFIYLSIFAYVWDIRWGASGCIDIHMKGRYGLCLKSGMRRNISMFLIIFPLGNCCIPDFWIKSYSWYEALDFHGFMIY